MGGGLSQFVGSPSPSPMLQVALKRFMSKDSYSNERNARSQCNFDPEHVVEALRWHDEQLCLVMPRADRSLDQAIRSERFAAHQKAKVADIMGDIARAIQEVHGNGWVHADIKPRNVVRVRGSWKLIDLDAATPIGGNLGRKRSPGFAAPELLRLDGALLPNAQPTFDVWSFGVVLYFLCTGQPLFALDALEDKLATKVEEARLREWAGIGGTGPNSLEQVFAPVANELEAEELESAKDLIAWCLAPKPEDRPQSMLAVRRARPCSNGPRLAVL